MINAPKHALKYIYYLFISKFEFFICFRKKKKFIQWRKIPSVFSTLTSFKK